MRDVGFDSVHIDAVGNVVGRYEGATPDARTLLTGSHYDTVRKKGASTTAASASSCDFGPRARTQAPEQAPALFLRGGGLRRGGRPALQGDLPGLGRAHRPLRPALARPEGRRRHHHARGHAACGLKLEDIPKIQRDPARPPGSSRCTSSRGRVLTELDLPLGIVTSINGSVRYVGEVIGMASHAGTTPMDRRRDAAAAVAELILYTEQRAAKDGDSVGTVGMLEVPSGSINVVPGRCKFSLDLRAPNDAQRDALASDVVAALRKNLKPPAACATSSRKRCAHPPPRAILPGSSAGRRPSTRWASRSSACPAAQATTP
ncbi:N-carbamoyl-L-amino acid hydrolase [Ditylenchus destructor]|uniref:N-carbamoyl-L-amino acid hydrolase n=1 Tax=Ditylenchus destructor TaxID=166010 RepID=A0AAD4QTR6_9BILA|nr:N-carbamoyl-L-amino acid hydrolase [Ditylenchus destructor]